MLMDRDALAEAVAAYFDDIAANQMGSGPSELGPSDLGPSELGQNDSRRVAERLVSLRHGFRNPVAPDQSIT